MVGSKVVTHCWISGWFQPSGISSCSVGCGGCKTSVRAGGFGGGGVGAWDGAAGAEDRLVLLTAGGEWVAQVVELLTCAGQFVVGVFEGA